MPHLASFQQIAGAAGWGKIQGAGERTEKRVMLCTERALEFRGLLPSTQAPLVVWNF